MTRRTIGFTWLLCLFSSVAFGQGQVEPLRDPGGAMMKSILVPGWGQWSNGNNGKAQAYFGAAAIYMVLALDLVKLGEGNDRNWLRGVGIGGYLFVAGAAGADAYQGAKRLNRENGYDLSQLPDTPRARLILVRVSF